MKNQEVINLSEWVKRVNQSWIVRQGLAERAGEWLDHLEDLDDGRLELCCRAALEMSQRRADPDDPKPWFYAGLFSKATADEAHRFLANHRMTPATVPAMRDDEAVKSWIKQIGPETRRLLERLREGLAECQSGQGRIAK